MMRSLEYQNAISTTLAPILPNSGLDTPSKNILHAALGAATEAGEIAEIVNEAAINGTKIDKFHIIEEAGDVLYYLATMINNVGNKSIDMVMEETVKPQSGDINLSTLGLLVGVSKVVDHAKRLVVKNKPVDTNELMNDVGKSLHYLDDIVALQGGNLSLVMEVNYNKINRRYPNGFSKDRYERSNRDLSAETQAMLMASGGMEK